MDTGKVIQARENTPPSLSVTAPKTRETDGRREVLDPVRRRWVTLTPEEEVRQHTILMLHNHYGYPLELMQVEGAITLNGMTRRCDIVVYRDDRPWMIVECKRPDIPINQKVCDQACRYNTVLQVPLLLLTNGRQQIVIEIDYLNRALRQLPGPPSFLNNVNT